MDSFGDIVYVRLMDEGGVISYRPAPAKIIGSDLARLLVHDWYTPDSEEWQFKPGSLVKVALKTLSGGEVLVAVDLVEGERSLYTE